MSDHPKQPSFKSQFLKQPLMALMEWAKDDDQLNGLIGYNELKNTYQFLKPLDDIQPGDFFKDDSLAVIKWYLIQKYDIKTTDNIIMQFIQLQARKYIVNPIKDWLVSLKWDGICRLDSWLHIYTGASLSAYTAQAGRILLCGAVNRILNPGCKYDYMVILEGEQGTMKSTLFEVLGGDYYVSLSFGHHEKEIVENIQGAWFIEIADMNGFGKKEIEWLRAFLARRSDRCRLPYARNSGDFKRQNVFVATTNPSGDNEYLKDDTGNRRFIPIETKTLNIVGLRDVRDQLFAEAVARSRELLYLTGDGEKIANEERLSRQESDIWLTPIREWVTIRGRTTSSEILRDCLHIDIARASLYDRIRIGRVMKKLEWKRVQTNSGEWEYQNPNSNSTLNHKEEITWE